MYAASLPSLRATLEMVLHSIFMFIPICCHLGLYNLSSLAFLLCFMIPSIWNLPVWLFHIISIINVTVTPDVLSDLITNYCLSPSYTAPRDPRPSNAISQSSPIYPYLWESLRGSKRCFNIRRNHHLKKETISSTVFQAAIYLDVRRNICAIPQQNAF